MNNQYLVNAISKLLQGLEKKEAEKVLADVKTILAVSKVSPVKNQPTCTNTIRRGRPCKISRDPEMEQFILSLDYMTHAEILNLLIQRFGEKRAPSRAGLSRYFINQRAVL